MHEKWNTNNLYTLFRSFNLIFSFKRSDCIINRFNNWDWKYRSFCWNRNPLLFSEWKKIRSSNIYCSKNISTGFRNFSVGYILKYYFYKLIEIDPNDVSELYMLGDGYDEKKKINFFLIQISKKLKTRDIFIHDSTK